MADDAANDGGNRATVAQTLAEVRGLRDFIDARFSDTQRQLNAVEGLPASVAELRAELRALDKREIEADADMQRRVAALENADKDDRSFWRKDVPMIVLTLALVVVTAITLLH